MIAPTKLTAHVKAGGCASKLSPKFLDQVLARVPRITNANVLVGFDTADDAGIYRLSPDLALVQTVDFFTPVVDDPFTYGRIAAANALSDVYAMGGTPVSALAMVCFSGKGNPDDLIAILSGGASVMEEASCAVVGGHSVNDEEIKFGYAVTGTINPNRILANSGARPGDALVFTKRIGTGVIGTALKRGIASDESVAAAIASMTTLNRASCDAMLATDAHACTDVTGFGLIGHSREMALASNVTLEIEAAALPLLPGALAAVRAGAVPGGLHNNRDFASCVVELAASIDPDLETLLYDPQTSGGLLIALPEEQASRVPGVRIGRVIERAAKPIRIV